MPVVIRELVIRATVNDASAAGTSSGNAAASPQNAALEKEALIQECVEQVLEILEKQKQR